MNKPPMIGFVSAPNWFDPAPAEFSASVQESVLTQQAPLQLPEFDYRLQTIANAGPAMELSGRCMVASGCDLLAQVGSPFAWANAKDEAAARARAQRLSDAAGVPAIMTSLALVDALRASGARRIAINCTYYEPDWRDQFAAFMGFCGFDVLHCSTLVDQGLAPVGSTMADLGWNMAPELTCASVQAVARATPQADAQVVTGAGTRTLALLTDLEDIAGCPLIAADTALYWAIARALNLTLVSGMGRLSGLG